ncbi:MFS transporter [Glycomyces buryatensis]|uniref:MFS transporter n=1 Tax=Glycomyces buryatensis TaxID=2570927 RepID=A0A4S8QC71_9ACTN|nr:MFS transporter [Glycomyces buryatensis]THV38649.1 MFS transporter [Glycomyces buryatensis]
MTANPPDPAPTSPSLFRDSRFRRYFVSAISSSVGYRLWMFIVPMVAIFLVDASDFQVGLLHAVMTSVGVLISLPVGVWLDRLPLKAVLVCALLGGGIIALIIPFAWWSGVLSFGLLAVVAFAAAVSNVLYETARQSILPLLVDRSKVVEANSRLSGVVQASNFAGPSLGGQIMAFFSAPITVIASAIGLLFSGLYLLGVKVEQPEREAKQDSNLLRDIGIGLRFVMTHKILGPIAGSNMLTNLAMSAYMAVYILFMARTLGASPGVIGIVLAIGSVGGIAGAFASKRITNRLGQGPVLLYSLLLLPATIVLFPLATPELLIPIGGLAGAGTGAAIASYNVVQISARQLLTPGDLLGRVMATFRFLNFLMAPAGALLGAMLASSWGPREALISAAVLSLFASLPIVFSAVRKQRDFSQEKVETATSS